MVENGIISQTGYLKKQPYSSAATTARIYQWSAPSGQVRIPRASKSASICNDTKSASEVISACISGESKRSIASVSLRHVIVVLE
jgi:hypothetical protein